MTRKHPKSEIVNVRTSMVDAEALRGQAHIAGGRFRSGPAVVTGKPVASRTDQESAGNIDGVGWMIKCLNPKDQGWASPEARKRWWSIVTELERENRALAKESLVFDGDAEAAKQERDRPAPALDFEQVKAQWRAVIHGWSQGLERERHRELDRQRSLERGHCWGRGQVRSFGAMGPTMI